MIVTACNCPIILVKLTHRVVCDMCGWEGGCSVGVCVGGRVPCCARPPAANANMLSMDRTLKQALDGIIGGRYEAFLLYY